MINVEQISEMLNLQDKMNTLASGKDWRNGISNKGKIINWRRCVYMELAEAIDSLPWKHWKAIDADIDYDNFKIEIIDIWHFIMSELLCYYNYQDSSTIIQKYLNISSQVELPQKWQIENNSQLDIIVEPYEQLMRLALNKSSIEGSELLVKSFFTCLFVTGIDFQGLYKLYVGKNVLNHFRQNHGYKEGTYIKIWNGEEDNVIMQSFLNDENITFEGIYDKLENYYSGLKK